jgi:hypothetical protein
MQCGLTFGSDFSSAIWETCRRMAEIMAKKLFSDESLLLKHKQHLDKLNWGKDLGRATAYTQAQPCAIHTGVFDGHGNPENTDHNLFVDDDIYAEVYDR